MVKNVQSLGLLFWLNESKSSHIIIGNIVFIIHAEIAGITPIKHYISAVEASIGVLLAQDNNEKKKQAMYYLSRFLNPVECKYSFIERLYYLCVLQL